ncbi:biliverdin-producing heme oxygenase [Ochrobactrum soli]|uniref:Biliverdin-producing heme oxygenase n=1 Tax=Ochrobactrum soli TaxID=2448455 RepID=A0A849KU92_9HYPH|nr:biliverdin-producing heme oxygenase [[Ochrobactrum] soli]NNU61074.1 biliverdin-producing heme oxygenase [[Ochrobactrum] soli]
MTQHTVPQRRWDLKAATAPHHDRIDRLGSLYGMFDSLNAYRKYLKATWHSRLILETLLDESELKRIFSDWDKHKIQSDLQQDYADLSDGEELKRPELKFPVGTRVDLPAAIGTLYVLEGSALGATFLIQKTRLLGLGDEYSARHLAKQVGNLAGWKKTVSLLESVPLDKQDEKRCIEAAIYSFRTFEISYEKAFGEP